MHQLRINCVLTSFDWLKSKIKYVAEARKRAESLLEKMCPLSLTVNQSKPLLLGNKGPRSIGLFRVA